MLDLYPLSEPYIMQDNSVLVEQVWEDAKGKIVEALKAEYRGMPDNYRGVRIEPDGTVSCFMTVTNSEIIPEDEYRKASPHCLTLWSTTGYINGGEHWQADDEDEDSEGEWLHNNLDGEQREYERVAALDDDILSDRLSNGWTRIKLRFNEAAYVEWENIEGELRERYVEWAEANLLLECVAQRCA